LPAPTLLALKRGVAQQVQAGFHAHTFKASPQATKRGPTGDAKSSSSAP
jgi:hypothetical protein